VDIYHVWCDLKPGTSDIQFAQQVSAYMEHLKTGGLIEGWRLTRRKLGFGPAAVGEFHIMIEVKDLAQLDHAFARVAGRSEPVEGFHFAVNSLVQNARFGLYRDFPDPFRQRGQEKFSDLDRAGRGADQWIDRAQPLPQCCSMKRFTSAWTSASSGVVPPKPPCGIASHTCSSTSIPARSSARCIRTLLERNRSRVPV